MPIKKKKGETKSEFLGRCVPMEVENGFPQEQAVAMCYSYWTSENLSDIRKIRRKKYLSFKKWRNTPNSANVAKIMYNDETRELVLQFNDKSIYTYFNVDFSLFRDIMDGNGVCRTEGENRWGEWYVGKTPSVGAAVYDKLVMSNIRYEKGGSLR